ncbi:IPT/TIG domain-containing protein [Ramlibacter tataouinensis]|uniref:IPT/TIG domain-containing protein n=1 Tax=Ramlibacter tataouinensis TaxID=94132 RepID=UPI0022F39EEB|nr:IPT/TIG domain-containing protein [Ramlibacter tataouinensis]WBY00632.1 IPT/TIG domain-containing protein [Ramlibacter tataouinensis]
MTDSHGRSRLHAGRILSTLAACLSLAMAMAGCGGSDTVPTRDARSPAGAPAPAPAAPTITAVPPGIGSTSGGDTVTLTGAGLSGATAVRLGTSLATGITVVSDTQLTLTAPPHSAGMVDVSVMTAHGIGTMAGAFSYRMAGLIFTLTGTGAALGARAAMAARRSPLRSTGPPAWHSMPPATC